MTEIVRKKPENSSRTKNAFAIILIYQKGIGATTYQFNRLSDLIVANAGVTMISEVGQSSEIEDSMYYLLCGGVIDLIEGLTSQLKIKVLKNCNISVLGQLPQCQNPPYMLLPNQVFIPGRSISEELKKDNISVTLSLPGYVRTNTHKRAGLDH